MTHAKTSARVRVGSQADRGGGGSQRSKFRSRRGAGRSTGRSRTKGDVDEATCTRVSQRCSRGRVWCVVVTPRRRREALRARAGLLHTVRSIEGREVSDLTQVHSGIYSNANRVTQNGTPEAPSGRLSEPQLP